MSDTRTKEEKEQSYLDGELAETEVINAINNIAKNSTLVCQSTKKDEFWTPKMDLYEGDIRIKYSDSSGKTHIKNIDVKKNGWVTLKSINAFGNDDNHDYVIWNGSVENSYAIKATTVRALSKKLIGTEWIGPAPRSGDSSMNLNDYNKKNEIRKKISLSNFIKQIDE